MNKVWHIFFKGLLVQSKAHFSLGYSETDQNVTFFDKSMDPICHLQALAKFYHLSDKSWFFDHNFTLSLSDYTFFLCQNHF